MRHTGTAEVLPTLHSLPTLPMLRPNSLFPPPRPTLPDRKLAMRLCLPRSTLSVMEESLQAGMEAGRE